MKKIFIALSLVITAFVSVSIADVSAQTTSLYSSQEEAAIGQKIFELIFQKDALEKELKQMNDSGADMTSQKARDLVNMIIAMNAEKADLEAQLQALRNPAPATTKTDTQAPFGGTAPSGQQNFGGKATPSSAQPISASFDNPLGGVDSLADLFYRIINFIIGLSYVVIAAFYLIAGFKFVKAQGNPEELSGAKRAFLNTTIGAIIIIGINVITQVIQSIIDGLQS